MTRPVGRIRGFLLQPPVIGDTLVHMSQEHGDNPNTTHCPHGMHTYAFHCAACADEYERLKAEAACWCSHGADDHWYGPGCGRCGCPSLDGVGLTSSLTAADIVAVAE